MTIRARWILVPLAGVLFVAALLPQEVRVWVDAEGRMHLTDRPQGPAPEARLVDPSELAREWAGRVAGEPLRAPSDSSHGDDRYLRELHAARDDVRRGETREGLRALQRLRREHPQRPEAAFLLAVIERDRGRLEPAREALDDVLTAGADLPERWRSAAQRLRAEIEDELRLARASGGRLWRAQTLASDHFHIAYDHRFAGRAYGDLVLEMLERGRGSLATTLGRDLARPLEVRLYTRAQYLERYRHRFGFATVGFYDGAIHVISGRHPRTDLYALLVHEYAHAIFHEVHGGHVPFFLNEGIAEREEERARGRGELSRGEWRQLLDAEREGTWVPLASLVTSFRGVTGKQAMRAYLESRAAVELIEERHPGAIARWLERCARGEPWERALVSETGWSTSTLDESLRASVRDRFPADPLTAKTAFGSGAETRQSPGAQ